MSKYTVGVGQAAIFLAIGYTLSIASGFIMHVFGVQGYVWDNLPIQALLFAILIALSWITNRM